MSCFQSSRLEVVITRRALLGTSLNATASLVVSACGRRRRPAFRGYAFIANAESKAIAVVDLEAMAVARNIPLQDSPDQLLSSPSSPFIYALSAQTGKVYEIAADRLAVARKFSTESSAIEAHLADQDRLLYVLAREPRALLAVSVDPAQVASPRPAWRLNLPEAPLGFAISPDHKTAAVTTPAGIHIVAIGTTKVPVPAAQGDFGRMLFLADSRTLIAANRGEKKLSLFDVASSRLITHLPLGLRPDHLCFNADGGQLFVTGEGVDAVVVVYPFHTPEVAETVTAGHEPGPMAVSQSFLFIASPGADDVSVMQIASRRVIAIAPTGREPGAIAVTPDDQFALILNRQSGDVSVLRIDAITRNRDRRASLLTVIPVGSRPVSAVVRAV